jgi:hypothetical protein
MECGRKAGVERKVEKQKEKREEAEELKTQGEKF